ncbi:MULTISPECIES: sialic acid TRAP transporter substrate-binding protein SiaP [Ramlibacter]|uniref:DctP family TRAP transporter solute-binding subunit n=1 Tax=Ramlibacter pinisoli TaxID=2682844 RepID=A0A6N8IYT8_9BURK|nr:MULTISPECIES: sialic acid TRAP transporter substrate-binding protein SiaP [Ramlibacter]MBA2962249.1 sialic acid TRAP transporter substrate-binding protein SiaP [Ramlibacter sp. CGMCC 1.13660]MVQ32191.1 DctP family TRAP transporter solute-binding subunit [Ramlibacter pinisoli]
MHRRTLTRLAALAAFALAAPLAGAQTTKLKWAHVYETSEPYHKQAVWAGEEIKKRSGGRYEIEVFPASSLGKETEINQGLTLGTVDIIYTGMAFAGRAYPPMSIASAPFVFRDYAHWQAFRNGPVFKDIVAAYGQKTGGQHIAGYTYYGLRHMTSNKPITKPEDMKGLKLRVPDAPLFTMFPKAVGANPTPIAFAEVYLALQNGTVDAQENPLPTIEAKKFYEVQKYITLTGHITESLVTIVAGPTWNKLNAADRKLFDEVLWEASSRAGQEIYDAETRLVADFEKKGKTVAKVDRAPFAAAVKGPLTAPDAPWPRELYDRIQAIK